MFYITKKQIFGTPKGDLIMFYDDNGHLRSAKSSKVKIISDEKKQKAAELMVQICQHWTKKGLSTSEFFTKITSDKNNKKI